MASDKQDKVLNVPTLRFPEFSGEWVRDNIFNVAPLQRGFDLPTQDIEDGEYPVVYSNGILRTHKYYKCEAPGLVTGRSGSIGNFTFIPEGNYWPHNTSLWVTNFHGNDPLFIYYLYQTINISQYATGSGVPTLNRNDVHRHGVSIPLVPEQRKIAEFLSLIDKRIVTQNRIIAQLKSLITRLNDFLMDNPSWENVRVGDFMDFYSTNSLSWEQLDYNQGEVKNLHYGLIHSGLPTLIDCRTSSLPNIKDEFLPKQYTLCEDGDVAFADASEDTNEVGKAVEIIDCRKQSIVCGLHTFHGRDKTNATIVGFKGFAFNAKYFHDQLRRISQGSKIYSISTDNIKSCFLRIPPKYEQEKIVRLLSTYLQKIDVAEQTLKAYQVQKQYLLKTLFI